VAGQATTRPLDSAFDGRFAPVGRWHRACEALRTDHFQTRSIAMRSAQVVGIALLVSGFAACGTVDDPVDVRTSALVVNQANVFGFEDAAQW